MTLLNLASDGLPSVLVALYSAVLQARDPMTREALLGHVAPPELVGDEGTMTRQTLNRWMELGLFKVGNDQAIQLAAAPVTKVGNEIELLKAVRMAARIRVLATENNMDIWASKDARAADLTRSLAWVLAQDAYRTAFSDLEKMEVDQLIDQDRRFIQNDTRKAGFQAWAFFLGFTRQLGSDIDPTVAVREVIPDCLAPGTEMPVENFLANLGEHLPVLDGGVYRKAVESQLRIGAMSERIAGQVSSSLSRALLGLRMEGAIVLEPRADMGSGITLTGRDGIRPDLRFQVVRRPLKEDQA